MDGQEVRPAFDAKLCPTCDGPVVDDSRSLYVTVYLPKQDRTEYFAQIHNGCGNPGWLPYVDVERA